MTQADLKTNNDVCYERLRPEQVIARRSDFPLAYLPLGVLEWHGPQNPLGLDGLKVHELCVRAATDGGGLVFPVPWYGEHRESHLAEANPGTTFVVADAMQLPVDSFSTGYMGGKTLVEQTLFHQDLLFHIYYQIRSLGFEAIYVLVGHGPLEVYAKLTAAVFERNTGVKMECSNAAGLVKGYQEDHAGRFETGVMMHLCPELVDLTTLPEGDKSTLIGIDGEDPRHGSTELGKAFVGCCVKQLAKAGHALLHRKASDGSMTVK